MRVLVTTLPGYGHLAPLIPLAGALRAAGHDAVFATAEGCRDALAAHGHDMEPCGPDWRESMFGHSNEPQALADLGRYFDTEVLPGMLRDMEAAVRRRRPDVVLSNDFEAVGRVVAERHDIPFVLASSGPRLPREVRAKLHSFGVAKARRLGGLSAENALDYSLRWLHLCFAPAHWIYCGLPNQFAPSSEEGPNEFGICPQLADLDLPSRAGRHAGRRPAALLSFGTVFNKRLEQIRTIALGVAPRVERLIVVLGPGLEGARLGDLPAHVEVHAQASVSTFLPDVDYVVTHAGASTLAALHLQGKPSLLLPQAADQPMNAMACRALGLSVVRFHTQAALVVGADGTAPMTPESVGEAFDELRGDPGYRERAEAFARSFHDLLPLQHAVSLIERLVATRAPVLKSAA